MWYNSRYFFLLPFLIFTFNIGRVHPTTSHHDLIRETCQRCAENDPNICYDFCVTSLQVAPHSHYANLRGIGFISIKLTRRNVTDTTRYVKELLKNQKLDPFIRACLSDCFDLYSDVTPTLTKAMNDYRSRHYEDANFAVSSAIDAATTCEDGFGEREGVVSPLTKRNNDTFQLSAMALSIINMLH